MVKYSRRFDGFIDSFASTRIRKKKWGRIFPQILEIINKGKTKTPQHHLTIFPGTNSKVFSKAKGY